MTKRLRVLVVEDSQDDAELVCRELRRGGFDVVFDRVETPEAMKQALQAGKWDAVISDHAMPHFSGPAALETLKATGLDVPFIIVSGTIGESTAVEAMRAGAHDYLLKGNLTRLTAALTREVKEAEGRRARRRAESARRESEARFKAVFDRAGVGMAVVDMDGRVVAVNRAFTRMLGYGLSQLRRMIFSEFTHPDDAKADLRLFKELLAGRRARYQLEERHVRKDGREVWGQVTVSVVQRADGEPEFAVRMVEDITVRKEAEAAAVQRARQLEVLNNVSAEIARSLDLRGIMETLTRQLVQHMTFKTAVGMEYVEAAKAVRLLAVYPRAALGRRAFQMVGLDLDDAIVPFEPDMNPVFARLFAGKEWVGCDVAKVIPPMLPKAAARGAQALHKLKSMLVAPITSQGKLVGLVFVGSDRSAISDEERSTVLALCGQVSAAFDNARLYEETLRQRNRLQALAREVIGAQEKERRYLAGEIHDRLLQSMVATAMYLESLDEAGFSEETSRRMATLMEALRQSVRDGRRMLSEMQPIDEAEPDMTAAVKRVFGLVFGEGGEVRLKTTIPPALHVRDQNVRTAVLRIIQEALVNVRKHAEAGRVSVRLEHSGGRVALEIRDDGVGFDKCALEASPLKHFGLLTMQERAALVGGSVSATSAPGQGTVVRGLFPLKGAVSEARRKDPGRRGSATPPAAAAAQPRPAPDEQTLDAEA